MAQPTFTESDLLLPQKQLDDLYRGRANRGLAQPLTDLIAEAIGVVRRYTAKYELEASQWMGLVRAIAIYKIMNFPGGSVPPQVATDYKVTMAELKDILDGKFADVLAASTVAAPTPAPRAGYGSRPVIPNTVYQRSTADAAQLASTGAVAGTNVQPGVTVN